MKKFLLLFAVVFSVNVFACKCAYQSFGENFAQNDFVAEIEILKTYDVDFNNGEDDRFYKADIKILKQIHSLGDEQYKRLMAYMKALQKLEAMESIVEEQN